MVIVVDGGEVKNVCQDLHVPALRFITQRLCGLGMAYDMGSVGDPECDNHGNCLNFSSVSNSVPRIPIGPPATPAAGMHR